MEHETRAVGKGCDASYAADNPDRTKAIEDHVRMLSRAGINEAEIRPLMPRIVDGLMGRLLLAPLDVLLDHRLYARFHGLRPSQFVGMHLRQNQNRNPLVRPEVSRVVPAPVRESHEIVSAAYALFVDAMTGGRTAYVAEFNKVSGMPLARELADEWRKAALEFHPGDEYGLLRQFVETMGLGAWMSPLNH